MVSCRRHGGNVFILGSALLVLLLVAGCAADNSATASRYVTTRASNGTVSSGRGSTITTAPNVGSGSGSGAAPESNSSVTSLLSTKLPTVSAVTASPATVSSASPMLISSHAKLHSSSHIATSSSSTIYSSTSTEKTSHTPTQLTYSPMSTQLSSRPSLTSTGLTSLASSLTSQTSTGQVPTSASPQAGTTATTTTVTAVSSPSVVTPPAVGSTSPSHVSPTPIHSTGSSSSQANQPPTGGTLSPNKERADRKILLYIAPPVGLLLLFFILIGTIIGVRRYRRMRKWRLQLLPLHNLDNADSDEEELLNDDQAPTFQVSDEQRRPILTFD